MSHSSAAAPAPLESPTPTSQSPRYEATPVVRHLAHELRQPLSTIESIAYYLDIVLPRDDRRPRKQVEKLQQVVQQANWILSDAVHFLQASAPAPQLLDLNEILAAGIRDASHPAQTWLHVEFCERSAIVRIDPEQAAHLARNVLFFFRQLAKPDPRVNLRCGLSDGQVVLEISADAGEYVPSDLNSMLEPFSPHLPAGSGLALASVRRIVEVHGGTIGFRTLGEARLLLWISLPRAD